MATPDSIGEILQSLTLPPVDNRRTGKFDDAIRDGELSRNAQILAMAEKMNLGEGHEEIFKTFINLGGSETEYDPARWELLREGYPANRGW